MNTTEEHLHRVSIEMVSEVTKAGLSAERRIDTTGDARIPAILISAGDPRRRARLMCYRTGRVSISGPPEVADRLCAPIAAAGLLKGWSPGSQGSGVSWASVSADAGDVAAGQPTAAAPPSAGNVEELVAWLRYVIETKGP